MKPLSSKHTIDMLHLLQVGVSHMQMHLLYMHLLQNTVLGSCHAQLCFEASLSIALT
jgi:hypothetical protein